MAISAAGAVLFLLEQQTGFGGETAALWILDLGTLAAALWATLATLRRARQAAQADRGPWLALGAALLAWSAGQLAWCWIELGQGRAVPTPSVADAGYGLFLPLTVLALLLSLRAGAGLVSRIRLTLEASLITLALFLVVWPGVVATAFEQDPASRLALFVNLLYPIGDVLVLGLCLFLLSVTPRGQRAPSLWILAGLLLFTISDVGFFTTSGVAYVTGTLLDVGWFVGLLCFALASFARGALEATIGPPTLARGLVGYGPPILAGAWTLGYQGATGGLDPVMVWVVTAMVSLTGVRGLLGLKENVVLRGHLESTVSHLHEAERQRTAVLHSVTHELKNPLVPLRVQLDLLRQGDGLADAQRRRLDAMDAGIARMGRLVEDFADVARIEGGRLRLAATAVDLRPVLQGVAEGARDTAAQRGIVFECALAEPLPVLADAGRVDQVVGNLLSNALKFTPAQGHVALRARRDGGEVIVEVTDSGRGLEQHEVARLFRPFSQVHARDEAKEPGTGLGLFICKSLIEAQGGRIGVASVGRGQGSRFWFSLPVHASGGDGALAQRDADAA